jgi:hypothetical protein
MKGTKPMENIRILESGMRRDDGKYLIFLVLIGVFDPIMA